MLSDKSILNLVIASYLEEEHVDRIRSVSKRLNVLYEPELLPTPRYPADHIGNSLTRTPDQEIRWQKLLQRADILFDFDRSHLEDLPELAPHVLWIQATSAGIGQLVKRWHYNIRLPKTIMTTARGIHARPLAEFCVMAMTLFSRGLFIMARDQQRKHWQRFAGSDLVERTLLIIGAGAIGTEVARCAKTLGMYVIGVKRRISGIDPSDLNMDRLYAPNELHSALRSADNLVLCAPHTDKTEAMLGAEELALLPRGAILINIGRGALVDEPALIEALQSGQLGGACLDVFANEPLPENSPLWEMPNVLISPHSASTSDRENRRLTDLFCDNLNRFLADQPLRNVFDVDNFY